VAEVLAALRASDVRASFAVTGAWAEANIELLRAIAADGHQLINGGRSGVSWTGASTGALPLTTQQRQLELSRTETSVFRLTNRSTRPFFRPPHGDMDASVARDAAAVGHTTIVLWSFDAIALDAAGADAIAARVAEAAMPGAIIRMSTDRDDHAAALPQIIESLRDRGVLLQTLDELAQ
jgi:peptidoglycan/xylan/chitin deacetylase (PgdA/CDA1 family)